MRAFHRNACVLFVLAAVVAVASSAPTPDPTPQPSIGGLKERYVAAKNGGRETYLAVRGDVTAAASTALAARLLQAEADYLYRRTTTRWLDREPPPTWMPVYVWHARKETHLPRASISTNRFNKVVDAEIALVGDLEAALERQLPREMWKLVMARHLHDTLDGERLPNWVRLGTPIVETLPDQEQVHQFDRFQKHLTQGRSQHLTELFKATDPYSEDRDLVLAQGYTLTRFLLTLQTRPKFVRFVELGVKDDWSKAVNEVYGFKSLDALEEAWLAWLKTPESRPVPKK